MPLSLPLVWSDAHRFHDPGAQIWVGVRTEADEVGARVETIRETLVAAGAPLVMAEATSRYVPGSCSSSIGCARTGWAS